MLRLHIGLSTRPYIGKIVKYFNVVKLTQNVVCKKDRKLVQYYRHKI